MKRILVVGPSMSRSKGGMSTVIEEIYYDDALNKKFDINVFESYIDGGKLRVLIFSVFSLIKFYFTKRNYDVYHIHMASYGSTFRKGLYVNMVKHWNKKVILHIHGAEYIDFYSHSSKKKKIQNILNKADLVIALSENWKIKFENIIGIKNCVVLENGIDEKKYIPAKANLNLYHNNLIMLGRMGYRKGTYDLLKAIEYIKNTNPEIKCFLAGDGELEKVKEIIKEKGLVNNVIVEGWVDFSKKIDLLKKTSILILPSYNEGLPMAILEGMASGKAIISTRVGAIPEVIGSDNGILVEPGDINGLVKSIQELTSDTLRLNSMSVNNVKKIQNEFSMEHMHSILSQYYSIV